MEFSYFVKLIKKVFWDYDLEIYWEKLHLCKINSTDVEFLLHYYVKIIKEKVWDNLLILENKFGMNFCGIKFHTFGIFIRCKMIKKSFRIKLFLIMIFICHFNHIYIIPIFVLKLSYFVEK